MVLLLLLLAVEAAAASEAASANGLRSPCIAVAVGPFVLLGVGLLFVDGGISSSEMVAALVAPVVLLQSAKQGPIVGKKWRAPS